MKRKLQKCCSNLRLINHQGQMSFNKRILKELATEITKPFSILFKQSISLMTVPKEWRNATVTAIFKKGNNSMPGDYRPVNLISGM
jgi:hypothetical protein